MTCLDANTVQDLMAGSLSATVRADAERHVDGCADCRAMLAALAVQDPLDEPALGLAMTLPDRAAGEPVAAFADGSLVGRYRVGRTLGAGGMGVVHEADDNDLGRKVAIKVLRPGTQTGAEERLRREAQSMARLQHPNVVTVHDVGVHDGRVFVAMELVDGKSLRDWLAERRRSVPEIVSVLAAAGRGLAAAHAAGLVHRDFKPDNVLVGRDGRVQVTDFGLARFGDSTEEPDVIAGTPVYMAPEQITGGDVDARSDQFSFCIALYEALYGERPFAGATFRELRDAVLAGKLRPAPARSHVPASLRAIVARGLSVRPGDRFASMDLLLAALGRDRTRLPRSIAGITAALALAAIVGLGADWIARERTMAVARERAMTVARASFGASSVQADRSLALRSETFLAMAELSFGASVMRDVTGNRDEADFGLGNKHDDTAMLGELHETLRSADWVMWARETSRSVIAVADYKGRLLYTSDSPKRWGGDVLRLPAAARAFAGQGDAAQVVRGDDPGLVATGITGDADDQRLFVVFARAHALGGEPRAIFVQVVDAKRLLEDVSLADGTLLAIVAPDRATAGEMPSPVIAAGLRATTADDTVAIAGHTWLVRSRPLRGLAADSEIARLVLARPVDVGLAGLSAGARGLLIALTISLVLASAISGMLARRGLRVENLTAPR